MINPTRLALGGIPDVFHAIGKPPAKQPPGEPVPPAEAGDTAPAAAQSADADPAAEMQDRSICRWDEV